MRNVIFLDTSVVCNIIPVPGLDQNSEEIKLEMANQMKSGTDFILPITTVIETGNHIAQVPNGDLRRTTAERFRSTLQMVIEGKAPWILHDIPWDKDFLMRFLAGAGTGSTYVEHATSQVGAGDLCILTEREQYADRTGINAGIWTLDRGLDAYNL
ncbi:hypothetical protein [Corynebacterium halotolerans]|uniref:PIN domain-containing protein n=1 Tax=Corynebacterium halotolerans YIM 70093 = DSM 44683 TaxID=1121362 RepID=M1PA76_9CORY|nr:hypothetical protein [Corynebacterium halotolerans]AGF73566.1 hypothetical protein A605_12850 [Corynebacterium halotolerans YIM 70093 = DSM 44683]